MISEENKRIASELLRAFTSLISGKKIIEANFSEYFKERLMNVSLYVKELFLEPSECQNNSFLLPHLTRDSYCTKGMFYRTDKVITHKHNPIFCDLAPKVTKDKLAFAYNIIEPKINQERTFVALHQLT